MNGKRIKILSPATPTEAGIARFLDERGKDNTRFGDNLADAAREAEGEARFEERES